MRLTRSLACFLLSAPGAALAASFPCERSTTNVENVICGTPELGELDHRMAALHRVLASTYAPVLAIDQKAWPRERNRCADTECVANAYRARIQSLDGWNERVAPDDGVFGVFAMPPIISVLNGNAWEEQPSVDCWRITRNYAGEIAFEFELTQTNAHLCSMQGCLQPIGDALEFVPAAGELPDADCHLRIEFYEREIILRDDDYQCQEQACGARASIEGTHFWKVAAKDGVCTGVVGDAAPPSAQRSALR